MNERERRAEERRLAMQPERDLQSAKAPAVLREPAVGALAPSAAGNARVAFEKAAEAHGFSFEHVPAAGGGLPPFCCCCGRRGSRGSRSTAF